MKVEEGERGREREREETVATHILGAPQAECDILHLGK